MFKYLQFPLSTLQSKVWPLLISVSYSLPHSFNIFCTVIFHIFFLSSAFCDFLYKTDTLSHFVSLLGNLSSDNDRVAQWANVSCFCVPSAGKPASQTFSRTLKKGLSPILGCGLCIDKAVLPSRRA